MRMQERKYVKLRVDMHEDIKFKIIDRMEERDLIHYIWVRLVTLAGKVNLQGELYMSKKTPYTEDTLAIEFNRDTMQIKNALKVLINLEMVEITQDKIYKVKNFAKHQNIKVAEKVKIQDEKNEIKDKDNKSELTKKCKPSEISVECNTSKSNSALEQHITTKATQEEKTNGIVTDQIKNEAKADTEENNNIIGENIFTWDDNTNINISVNEPAGIHNNDSNKSCSKSYLEDNNQIDLSNKKMKKLNKSKTTRPKITNEINVEDKDEEIIELKNEQETEAMRKGEKVIMAFSFD